MRETKGLKANDKKMKGEAVKILLIVLTLSPIILLMASAVFIVDFIQEKKNILDLTFPIIITEGPVLSLSLIMVRYSREIMLLGKPERECLRILFLLYYFLGLSFLTVFVFLSLR